MTSIVFVIVFLFLIVFSIEAYEWYDNRYPIRRVHGKNMSDLKSRVRGKTLTINGRRFRIIKWQSLTQCLVRTKMLPTRWWL